MAADDPRSIVASWDTAHKASMLLERRERKGLCRPRACPENPLELVLVCLNNSTGFFAQTVARFEGECQGTETPCREPPVSRKEILKRCTKSSSKLRFYEETMSCRLDTAPEPLSPGATYCSSPCCIATPRSRVVDPIPQRCGCTGRLAPQAPR